MRMTLTVAIHCLDVVGCSNRKPKGIDLPGMSVVAEHHGLSEETLQNTWRLHVREAVLVSQGWVWVESLKEGG